MASLIGIQELKNPKTTKTPTKYVSPNQPFIKVREKGNGIPFHEGFIRKEVKNQVHCTASSYSGTVDSVGFAGYGVYTYPHGVIYEGEFRDGQFHGKGVLIYPRGQKLEGVWYKGNLISKTFKTGEQGNIEYNPKEYLEFPKRVTMEEIDENNEVNCTEEQLAQPKHVIPNGCFDTGDGYFEPSEYVIYSYDGKKKRIATIEELQIIEKKYRQMADNTVGYLPEIYEYWTSGRAQEVDKIKEERKKSTNESKESYSSGKGDISVYSCNFLSI